MEANGTRSEASVSHLQSARGGLWPYIRWIHRRRPLLTAIIVLVAPAHTLATNSPPADLLSPQPSARIVVAWALMLFGVAVRLWGSGNLRKNQEITKAGVYVIVRHPLYVGSLSLFLAYFLSVGDPIIGAALFAMLVLLVYYPTMLGEEEYLTFKFPLQHSNYHPPPRLIPDARRFPEALRTDRFEMGAAYRNLGFRSAWVLIALPLFLEILDRVRALVW